MHNQKHAVDYHKDEDDYLKKSIVQRRSLSHYRRDQVRDHERGAVLAQGDHEQNDEQQPQNHQPEVAVLCVPKTTNIALIQMIRTPAGAIRTVRT